MRFELATATRIIFGSGTLREAGPAARAFGQRALVVTGRTTERAARLLASLSEAGVASIPFCVAAEPTMDRVRTGTQLARDADCDLVIALGGGSVVDAGKAIAVLMTNSGDLLNYLEVIGGNQPLEQAPVPFLAIPTTAGTGAEVTRNAVLASPEHRVKVSLRSPFMLPRLALVDPELTLGLPAHLTASTGLDALTQLIEAFVSIRANPITNGFCREGISRVVRSLRRAGEEPCHLAAREDMAMASLLSGLALANAGLGAVHGFAAPIGGMFAAPHGAVCAALLPIALDINLRALRERQPKSDSLPRFREVARLLTGRPKATEEEGVLWIEELCRDLKISPLASFGITPADLDGLCMKATAASSMKGNPIQLTSDELRELLSRAL